MHIEGSVRYNERLMAKLRDYMDMVSVSTNAYTATSPCHGPMDGELGTRTFALLSGSCQYVLSSRIRKF